MTRRQLEEYCDIEFESIEAVLAEYSTAELAAVATFIHNCCSCL